MGALTVAELSEQLVAIQNEKDEVLAEIRGRQLEARKALDAAIARESAAKKLAGMSDDELAAVKAELGVEA